MEGAAACLKLKHVSMLSVTFTDTQLQACFERNLEDTDATDELRQVRALMATYGSPKMVRDRGFEPLTPSVSRKCSTTELTAHCEAS